MKKLDRETVRNTRLAGLGSLAGTLPPVPDAALLGGMTDAELEEAFGSDFPHVQVVQPKPSGC